MESARLGNLGSGILALTDSVTSSDRGWIPD